MLNLPDIPNTSITQRIVIAVRAAIADERFKPGAKLPARRELAAHLGLDARTVGEAYSRLEAQGLVTSRVGSGTYINDDALTLLRSTDANTHYKSITIVAEANDLASCHRDALRVLADVIEGLHDVLGLVKINLVESFNQDCLGHLTSDDAVLIFRAQEVDPAMTQVLAKRDVPIIGFWSSGWLDTLGGLVPQVDYHRQLAAQMACEHLINCGYRQIGFIGDMGTVLGIRFCAFTNTLFRANIDYQVKHVREAVSYRPGMAYQAAARMIQDADLPEAIFADTDYKAMEIMEALKDAGLQVPGDVGIISHDDVPEAAEWHDQPLTTIRSPRRDIGRCVGEMLKAWKLHRTPLKSQTLMPELMVRGTTRVKTAPPAPAPAAASQRGNRAFTIIELLVVISIIVLLIAILLPTLSSARIAAQKVVSLSNVRQISVSLNVYANDNRSSLPFLERAKWTGSAWDDTNHFWPETLDEGGYLTTMKTYWSPQRTPQTDLPSWEPYRAVGYGMSRGVSGYEVNYNEGDMNHLPMHLGKDNAPPPSTMLMLVETWHSTINKNGYYEALPNDQGDSGHRYRLFNYQGGVVRAYLDGRAHGAGAVSTGTTTSLQYISSRLTDISAGKAPTHIDELGWRSTWPPDSVVDSATHTGDWAFTRDVDYQQFAPWYINWRTKPWFIAPK